MQSHDLTDPVVFALAALPRFVCAGIGLPTKRPNFLFCCDTPQQYVVPRGEEGALLHRCGRVRTRRSVCLGPIINISEIFYSFLKISRITVEYCCGALGCHDFRAWEEKGNHGFRALGRGVAMAFGLGGEPGAADHRRSGGESSSPRCFGSPLHNPPPSSASSLPFGIFVAFPEGRVKDNLSIR